MATAFAFEGTEARILEGSPISISPNEEKVRARILESVNLQGRVREGGPRYLEVAEGSLSEVSDRLRVMHCGWVRVQHPDNNEGWARIAIRPLTVYFL